MHNPLMILVEQHVPDENGVPRLYPHSTMGTIFRNKGYRGPTIGSDRAIESNVNIPYKTIFPPCLAQRHTLLFAIETKEYDCGRAESRVAEKAEMKGMT
jgi:hypothetical protein